MSHKKSNGEVVGHVPFGYARDGDKLVTNLQEQAVKKFVNDLYVQELRVAQIVRRTTDAGYCTRTGKAWTSQQAKQIINDYESAVSIIHVMLLVSMLL